MLLRSLVSICDNAATRFPAPLLPSLQHTPKPEAIVAVAHAARHEVSISYTRLLVATLACVPICLAHTAAAGATHGADTRPPSLQMGLATPCRIYRAQRFLSSDAAKRKQVFELYLSAHDHGHCAKRSCVAVPAPADRRPTTGFRCAATMANGECLATRTAPAW